jgi:UV DNA damage endonuclease
MIRIGYAGVNTELPSASSTFRLARYSVQRMLGIASANLAALQQILAWNADHGVHLFRITSNLIPFGSHPVNRGEWRTALKHDFARIGRFIRDQGMRVSMHPGQYSVLNSPHEATYENTLQELVYHETVFTLMELGFGHKIVIHGGGAYGNKAKAARVLVDRIAGLDSRIRLRLVLENDEHVFTARDILAICETSGIPGVLDVFHHRVLPSLPGKRTREVIGMFAPSWAAERQKIHYSNQEPGKVMGSHSSRVDIDAFREFHAEIRDLDIDIMLEVKDKQASVLALRKEFPDLQ